MKSSREYRMRERAAGVAATRHRIVKAAMALHAERGTTAVRWEDIAHRAGVHPATVYRHFRTLDDLLPACMGLVFEAGMPTPATADAIFAGVEHAGDRFEKLIRESCRCYGLAPRWLEVARTSEAAQAEVDAVGVLVRAALGRPVDRDAEAILRAFVDFPFWRSLGEAGMTPQEATDAVVALVREQLRVRGLE